MQSPQGNTGRKTYYTGYIKMEKMLNLSKDSITSREYIKDFAPSCEMLPQVLESRFAGSFP